MRASFFPALIAALAFTLIVALPFQAQRGGGPPVGAGGPQPSKGPTRPDSIQDSNVYDYWSAMDGQTRAGGALLGKIAVEGEPLPWEPVLINVTCSGNVVYQTQTDAKGNFGIVPQSIPHEISQLKDTERQMQTHYEGCLVNGVLAGFGSKPITITERNLRDDPILGTLMLYRTAQDAATTLSSTSEHVPAGAMKDFEKARADMIASDRDGAERELKKAVAAYPDFAEAWLQLGKLQESSDAQQAHDSFSKAIQADPKFVLPYEQLAMLASQSGNWKEVLDNTNHVIQLYPDGTPPTWYLNALANYQLGNIGAAEKSASRSLAIDPRHTVMNTEQLLAVILARQGDYPGALKHLTSSLKYIPAGPNADLLKQQIAQLEQRVSAK